MLLHVQYISRKGFRVCVKELYEATYDPLFISYIVLSGKNFTAKKKKIFYGISFHIVSYLRLNAVIYTHRHLSRWMGLLQWILLFNELCMRTLGDCSVQLFNDELTSGNSAQPRGKCLHTAQWAQWAQFWHLMRYIFFVQLVHQLV